MYALGTIAYDFGTEARRDSIAQRMKPAASPDDRAQFVAYLNDHPFDTASVIWTLNQDSTPIYAVQPQGPFARDCYLRLLDFYQQQWTEGVERVSIPGTLGGTARLSNGFSVPVLVPEMRGMYSWTAQELVKALVKEPKGAGDEKTETMSKLPRSAFISIFRNLGLTPGDRAINFSATNAFNVSQVFEIALREQMQLDSISVERSPFCEPESDYWDVKLIFFDPKKQLDRARARFVGSR